MKKKRIVLLLFAISLSICAFPEYSIGVKAGYKTSVSFGETWKFNSGEYQVKDLMSNGFNVGLMTRFGKRIYAQIEALYDFQNSNYNIQTVGSYNKKIHTIDLPVMIGFKILNYKNFNWRIMAGPTFNFSIKTKNNLQNNDIKYNIRGTRVGLDCGTGVDIWRFAIDLRYQLLQNPYNYIIDDKTVNSKPINNFEISVAFKIIK